MEKETKKASSKTSETKERRPKDKDKAKDKDKSKDDSKVHKLSLKGSSRLVAEFVCYHPIHTLSLSDWRKLSSY